MVFFDSLVGFVREKVLGGVKEAVINNLPVENKYGEFGSQGKILSWVESLPVVGKILENLGPNRKQLYKIIIETKPVENLRNELRKLPASLPLDDPLSKLISGFVVHTLHSNMLHPPQTYLGNKFQYRSADGSDNNMLFPQLGKAGMPYAKSVPNLRTINGSQPDPGDLFDLLLARDETDDEQIRDSNLGLSSMLLYHATVIIHDIFRTNNGDKNISDTSSYLDLSPLYGKDAQDQKAVRAFTRGLLKPDSFAEERLLNQPVGVCIYLVMYNRFHNYVAQQLLEINENGKFFVPPKTRSASWKPNAKWQPPREWKPVDQWKPKNWQELDTAKQWSDYRQNLTDAAAEGSSEANDEIWKLWSSAAEQKLDEDLFQTARLITCGMYINISIHDYLRVLMRVHLKDTPWTLDPRKEIPIAIADPRGIQRGQGNQVSVEFNVLYRFHSPLSRRDVRWTNDFLTQLLQSFVDAETGPSLTKAQLETFDIPIPVMAAALAKMYALLPPIEDKLKASAIPEGLEPIFEGENKRSYRFKRDPVTHKFDDTQLVREMVKVLEDPTCEFGAKNTARLFRSIEILGILQARKWELASLNEFRKFFNLPEHKKFSDINSDPLIQNKLENLYRHPDQVELYPGLVCEGNSRCLDPGTECPSGDTALWGAVFCDAVTLVRSDRFYTTDWNVGSLTGWGMREVTSIPEVMKGSVMHRLFQRAFPGFFPYNSLHLWQPFHLPAMNYVLAKSQGKLGDLEALSELGLDPQKIKEVEAVVNFISYSKSPLTDDQKLQAGNEILKREQAVESKIKPLKELEEKRALGYTKIEAQQIKEALTPKTMDIAGLQLAFKPLKRVIKMPDSRFTAKKTTAFRVSSYSTVVEQVLANPDIYKNPGFLDDYSIPEGPLRKILTGKLDKDFGTKVAKALSKLRSMVDSDKEQLFSKYFEAAGSKYLQSGSRNYEKQLKPTEGKAADGRVSQIDVVSDYAMPVIGQFVTDFLGFWDWTDAESKPVKTDASIVYGHLNNCQDYLTYNSDETTVFPRRIEFRESIKWLNNGAVYGIQQVVSKKRGTSKPDGLVSELQQFGTKMAQELLSQGLNKEEAAAIRLSIALEAVHKSILMFTEVLNYLLHGKQEGKYIWELVQNRLSAETADSDLRACVLEAQRLAVRVPLVRQIPAGVSGPGELPITDDKPPKTVKLEPGHVLLIDTYAAQQNPEHFDNPSTFNPKRDQGDYILYGRKKGSPFTAKHLTIIAVTALIKKAASLKELRRAHDMEGRLNKAKTPDGVERYLTQEFEQLVPFPTTWQLRYNGIGPGVYKGGDNSEVEHGMDQIYQDGALSAEGGTHTSL